jgi:hypothetical protein
LNLQQQRQLEHFFKVEEDFVCFQNALSYAWRYKTFTALPREG